MKNILVSSVTAAVALTAATLGARTVKVSDFGYDPTDSTKFLQAALDSGAAKVIVDRRSGPWVTKPLFGRSDTEIVFEEGAEIVAKKGEFLGQYEALLTFAAATNITVRGLGSGGTLRMLRDDYTKPPYKRAEWRHALNILSCVNVTVENMKMCESGGDGVYVGNTYGKPVFAPCRNVTMRDCVMDRNLRQGVSVITVDGLLMERCVMSNTGGTLPMAGIDFEPNMPTEVIRNAVLRDCRTFGNRGSGYELAFMSMISNSAPISITLENCTSENDSCSFRFNGENMKNSGYVSGLVTLRGCTFRDPRGSFFGIALVRPATTSFSVENCRGVHGETVIEMTPDWIWRNFPLASSRAGELPGERLGRSGASVVDEAPGKRIKLKPLKFRNVVRYAFYAAKPGPVNMSGFQVKLGRYPVAVKPIVIRDAGGRDVATAPMPGEKSGPISFDVPAAGFYDMIVDVGRRAFALDSSDVPVAADVTNDWRDGLASVTTAWISVPENNGRFAVYASGSGGGELVGVRLTDPSGTTVWEDSEVEGWKAHVSGDRPRSGLWRFDLLRPSRGTFEDFKIDLAGVQGYFFLSPSRHW